MQYLNNLIIENEAIAIGRKKRFNLFLGRFFGGFSCKKISIHSDKITIGSIFVCDM